jgi:AAA domain
MSWQPIDLATIESAELEPPAIGGIVYPGRRHVFSGEPESLKSMVAMALAFEVIGAGGCVIWIDVQENGRRETHARLRAFGFTEEQIARFIYIEPDEPIGASTSDVEALIQEREPRLVIVDSTGPLLALHGLDPNVGRDIDKLHSTVIAPLRLSGAAIILLDHLPKDREGRGKFAIGSERKIGAVDVHQRFEAKQPFGRGRTGIVEVRTLKDRPGHLPRPRCATITLQSDLETGTITHRIEVAPAEQAQQAPSSFRPTVLMERVSRHVEQATEPVSRRAVTQAVTGNEVALRMAIDTLTTEGYLQQTPGPNRAQLLTIVRPYREAECDQCDHSATKCDQDAPATSATSATNPLQGGRTHGRTPKATTPVECDHEADARDAPASRPSKRNASRAAEVAS